MTKGTKTALVVLGVVGVVVLAAAASGSSAPAPGNIAAGWKLNETGNGFSVDPIHLDQAIQQAKAKGVPLYVEFMLQRIGTAGTPPHDSAYVYAVVQDYGIDGSDQRFYFARVNAYSKSDPADVPPLGTVLKIHDRHIVQVGIGLK